MWARKSICMKQPAGRLWYPYFLTRIQGFSYCGALEEESTSRCHGIEQIVVCGSGLLPVSFFSPGLSPSHSHAVSPPPLSSHTLFYIALGLTEWPWSRALLYSGARLTNGVMVKKKKKIPRRMTEIQCATSVTVNCLSSTINNPIKIQNEATELTTNK